MELTPKQQVVELIKKSQKILLLTPKADGDSLGAMLSLFLIFEKLGKDALMLCPDETPSNLKFLPRISEIKKNFDELKNFVITLDTSKTQVAKLGYKTAGQKLNIIITPRKGGFTNQDVSFGQGLANLDLIIILDAADLSMLGALYDENTEIFYKTPVLNIDHHASNSSFGKINLVDMTATSTCEILVSIIEALAETAGQPLMSEEIATNLLTGVITDTGSFQNANTTPKSFTVAAQLIAQGAKQQEIIKQVYKTKPLTTLRLWGRILASIREDKDHKFIWSIITLRDLEQTGASESEISGVINELLSTAPDADIVVLLSERENEIHCSLRTAKGVDAVAIAQYFGGGGHPQAAAFQTKGEGIADVERKVLTKIREYQSQRLGLPQPSSTFGPSQIP